MLDDIRDGIYKKILAEFGNSAKVLFDNQSESLNANESYIFVNIAGVTCERLEIGFDSFLATGHAEIKILIPENDGSKKAWRIADGIKNIFLNKRVDNLNFLNMEIIRDGLEDSFFGLSVKIFFEKDFINFS